MSSRLTKCFRPETLFTAGKETDCCIALLAAMLISPLTLLMGHRLYGEKPAISASWAFMVSVCVSSRIWY